MQKKGFYGLLVVMVIIALVGCKIDNNAQPPNTSEEPTLGSSEVSEPSENDNGTADSNGIAETNIIGETTEMNRGGETYDYDEWVIMSGAQDIFLLVSNGWNRHILAKQDSDRSFYTIWADSDGSEIVLRINISDLSSPREAVMEKVAALQKQGVDIEYGELDNILMTDGYYYRRVDAGQDADVEKEKWDSQIFFRIGPEEEKRLDSISLKLNVKDTATTGAISEEAFFKMANSFYLGPDPEGYYFKLTGEKKEIVA